MVSENEKIADILAEIRGANFQPPYYQKRIDEIANRIEAAWKRESEPKPLTIEEFTDHEESIADIAAVLRRYVLPSLADRLEAAWKRERESLLTKQGENVNSGSAVYMGENNGGNAAAMREALVNCAKMGEQIDYQLGSSDETVYAFRHERCLGHNISECARAAISAPPRNCDIYQTNEDAWRSYQLSHAKNADAYVEATVPDFIDWLFAPAEKGASDE